VHLVDADEAINWLRKVDEEESVETVGTAAALLASANTPARSEVKCMVRLKRTDSMRMCGREEEGGGCSFIHISCCERTPLHSACYPSMFPRFLYAWAGRTWALISSGICAREDVSLANVDRGCGLNLDLMLPEKGGQKIRCHLRRRCGAEPSK
jgi:hypothetical protein